MNIVLFNCMRIDKNMYYGYFIIKRYIHVNLYYDQNEYGKVCK